MSLSEEKKTHEQWVKIFPEMGPLKLDVIAREIRIRGGTVGRKTLLSILQNPRVQHLCYLEVQSKVRGFHAEAQAKWDSESES